MSDEVAKQASALVAAMEAESVALGKRRRKLEEDEVNWKTLANKFECSQIQSPVTLDVGGMKFKTSLVTLTAISDSYFGAMFSGRWELKAGSDGCYFIDRNPAVFSYILDFLRAVAHEEQVEFLSYVPEADLPSLLREAKYYLLKPLIKLIEDTKITVFESELIGSNPDYVGSLCQFLQSDGIQVEGKRFRLLYRASRDSWNAVNFHTMCDNRGATLVIVQSGPSLFGGYTSMAWDSSGAYKNGPAFLFSLRRPNGGSPVKLTMKPGASNHIYCGSNYGPTFGSGHDLHICDNSDTISNSNSNLGNTYSLPVGEVSNSYLTGAQKFTCTEIEVLQIN